MANQEHTQILAQGVAAWNRWRMQNDDVLPDLEFADFTGALLSEARLSKTNFTGADLSNATLSCTDLTYANLTDADLRKADLNGANLYGAILSGAYLWGANLIGAELQEANLSGANLVLADLSEAKLMEANFDGSDLAGCNLTGANLAGADFSSAELDCANLKGANLSGANLVGANLAGTNLWEANFSSAVLTGTNLKGKYLSAVTFRKALIEDADLRNANLIDADFREANLMGADFREANLTDADFREADLSGSDFTGSVLTRARFTGAVLDETRFSSKSTLNTLARPLTQEQLLGCIFIEDEKARKRRKAKQKSTAQVPTEALILRVTNDEWTPMDLSLLFLATQLVINKIQYLATTHEQSHEEIVRQINGLCYPANESEHIRIHSLSLQSPFWEALYYVAAFAAGSICLRNALSIINKIVETIKAGLQAKESYHSSQKLIAEREKLVEEAKNIDQASRLSHADKQFSLPVIAPQQPLSPLYAALQNGGCETLGGYQAPLDFTTVNPVVEKNKDALTREACAPLATVFEGLLRQGCTIHVELKVVPSSDKTV